MRSASVLDRHASSERAPTVRDLLVLWQHPETREIVPIGRFVRDGPYYTFSYTQAAATIEDFRPLPGLDNLRHRYTSSHIPAVFSQRIMEPDRPDYADYLHAIGLDPVHATPWEQIVHSGGSRAGDTLQFMQVPTVTGGRARARFLASGVRHIPDRDHTVGQRTVRVSAPQHDEALLRLSAGDSVRVEAEEHNDHDACATLITTGGVPLGWVPRALSASIRELLQQQPVTMTVVRVGDAEIPPHLRLVVDLDVPSPPGFQFDREGRWEPLTTQ